MSAKSTGCEGRDDALLVVARWLSDGMPTGRRREARPAGAAFGVDAALRAIRDQAFNDADALAVLGALAERGFVDKSLVVARDAPAMQSVKEYLETFWDETRSPYIRGERARGRTLTKRHILGSAAICARLWLSLPGFGEKKLGALRRKDLQEALATFAERGLSPGSLAQALAAIRTPLAFAVETEILASNPCVGVRRIFGQARERGILSDEELSALGAASWPDDRARVAFLIAASTGLRIGECQALRYQDIGEDRLFVRHSWSDVDLLKAPKNGKAREAVLLPEIRAAMLEMLESSPHPRGPDSFILYAVAAEKPAAAGIITAGFRKALESIGIDKAAREARSISFHSLRHGFAKRMSSRLETEVAMQATGHLSKQLLEHYADHREEADFQAIASAARAAFGKVLTFKKAANA